MKRQSKRITPGQKDIKQKRAVSDLMLRRRGVPEKMGPLFFDKKNGGKLDTRMQRGGRARRDRETGEE